MAEFMETAIWIIENQTPNEVQRLRKLLVLAFAHVKLYPKANPLLVDSIARELGIDDLKIQKFKRDFEKAGKND